MLIIHHEAHKFMHHDGSTAALKYFNGDLNPIFVAFYQYLQPYISYQ